MHYIVTVPGSYPRVVRKTYRGQNIKQTVANVVKLLTPIAIGLIVVHRSSR